MEEEALLAAGGAAALTGAGGAAASRLALLRWKLSVCRVARTVCCFWEAGGADGSSSEPEALDLSCVPMVKESDRLRRRTVVLAGGVAASAGVDGAMLLLEFLPWKAGERCT